MSPSKKSSKRPSTRSMTEANSPYNFVPHTREVVIPPWDKSVSHSRPFTEGVSGTLTVHMKAKTPVMVADGEETQQVGNKARSVRKAFLHSDGKPGIPGSSLRGMLRSVVEIITHSKLSKMNDFYFGIRDLHNPELYGDQMAQIVDREPTPLVCAGWLRPNPNNKEYPATLIPCDYGKVEYGHIVRHAQEKGVSSYVPGRKQSAVKKYQSWLDDQAKIDWKGRMKVQCTVEKEFSKTEHNGIPRIGSYYRKTTALGRGLEGYLVFTGQPANYDPAKPKRPGAGNPKHHDFVFLRRHTQEIQVSKKVFEGFVTAHSASGQQHRLTDSHNEELTFWMAQSDWSACRNGKEPKDYRNEIPVFFLLKPKKQQVGAIPEIRSIGLAQMFRLAYDHTTKEMAPQTWMQNGTEIQDVSSRKDRPAELPFDMAELMFGHICTKPKEAGQEKADRRMLKGRVQIGHAHLKGGYQYSKVVKSVLGGPKASFYPYYIEQKPSGFPGSRPLVRGVKASYKTYMDDPSDSKNAQIRGYKRYIVRPDVIEPTLPQMNGKVMDNDKVVTCFEPVKLNESAYFETQITVHNMLPEEVGALVWALQFGGQDNTFHQIGMAKSLGYGVLDVSIAKNNLISLQSLLQSDSATFETVDNIDLQYCLERFEKFMNAEIEGWSSSRRIFELLQMATPVNQEESQKSKHPTLSHPEYGNMFVGIKKAGLALPSRGKTSDYLEWSSAKRAVERQAKEAEDAKRAAQEAAANAEAQRREQERLDNLTATARAKEIIETHEAIFRTGAWFDWLLGRPDTLGLDNLPAFGDIEETQVFMTWLDEKFNLWQLRNNIPTYASEQQQEVLTVLRAYVPKDIPKGPLGISKKELRKLNNKNENTRSSAARRIMDALETLNVKKSDALKALTELQKNGLIETSDLDRLRAYYTAQS